MPAFAFWRLFGDKEPDNNHAGIIFLYMSMTFIKAFACIVNNKTILRLIYLKMIVLINLCTHIFTPAYI